MIKQYITIGLLVFIPSLLMAQGIVNKGATIKVLSGTDVKSNNGGIINKNTGAINNNGNLYLDTDFDQTTGATYAGGATSWLWFEGTSNQNTSSDATLVLNRLRADNGNRLILGTNTTISESLDFQNNTKIELGTNNLVLSSGASITNYDANNYVVTNSTGILQQEVGASGVVFPIGMSSYNPATLNNTGVADNFQVRIFEQVFDEGTTGTVHTTDAVDRTWMIEEEVGGGSDVSLTLQWITADEMTSFDRATSGIAHHLSTDLWDNPTPYTAATSVGVNTWTQTRSGFTSFSPFVVRDLDIDLPVELLSFDATRIDAEDVELNWATASEINNKGFWVERMLEHEIEFTPIDWVEGQGTTVITTYYQILDDNSYSDISYYRLKQVDFDGTISYSEIRAVAGSGGSNNGVIEVGIYPNPVLEKLIIQFNSLPKGVKTANVKIIGINGQALYEQNNDIQSYKSLRLDYVSRLVPATYILSIDLDNGENISHKFIKN